MIDPILFVDALFSNIIVEPCRRRVLALETDVSIILYHAA